jgi:hypothetical protein
LLHSLSSLGASFLKLCFRGTGGSSRQGPMKQRSGRGHTAAELPYESEKSVVR